MARRKSRIAKIARRRRVKRSVRSKVTGTPERPRLSVFRSNKNIYAQLIDDTGGHTMVSASSLDKDIANGIPTEVGARVGVLLAERAREIGVDSAVFDRNGYRYLGRVKSLAEGARKGGLTF